MKMPAGAEMTTILHKIIAYKKEEVAFAKSAIPAAEMNMRARSAPPTRRFFNALDARRREGRPGLIAEVKKASPSKGLIRTDFDPAAIATAYERGGAACLSVLTDGPSFQGSPRALADARNATRLPVLRKDFMVDIYQIAESRAMGADCILIIMACTCDGLAGELIAAASSFGMDALIEVHDEGELDRALALGARLIGINNRDLKTFETRLETTERLTKLIPEGPIVISESGIFSAADIGRLSRAGAHAFLVGESLMRQENIEEATRALLAFPPVAERQGATA
jgi:indole-3-glycerol phosphate synthase